MQTKNAHGINDKELFKNHEDYWQVADNIRNIYMSDGSLTTLLDFERVLDELDIYAFRNWAIGELVQGPDIGKYTVGCIFMWPEKLMPDPRGGRRTGLSRRVGLLRHHRRPPARHPHPLRAPWSVRAVRGVRR